jgi:hypothetical protein
MICPKLLMATADEEAPVPLKKANIVPDVALDVVGCQRNACDVDVPTT